MKTKQGCLNGQTFSALSATTVDDFSTVFGSHSFTKSVFSCSFDAAWFIGN